jgi:hypothetical protein
MKPEAIIIASALAVAAIIINAVRTQCGIRANQNDLG